MCFWRSAVAASSICLISVLLSVVSARNPNWSFTFRSGIPIVIVAIWVYSLLVDYVSLLKARWLLGAPITNGRAAATIVFVLLDFIVTFLLSICSLAVSLAVFRTVRHAIRFDAVLPTATFCSEFSRWVEYFARHPTAGINWSAGMILEDRSGRISDFGFNFSTLTIYPAFLTSIWLWLYAGSGFLLKAVRRFDIGLEWFNRRFDIEKKPLRSIGLVAGALVAALYWVAVIMSRII
jgi:hypothetical protein